MKNDPEQSLRSRTEAGHWGGMFRVAIIGAATLKGRELKEVLSDRNFPANDIRLLDDEESLGQMEAVGEEPTFIQSVLPEHLENVDFTFFASDEDFTRSTWPMARKAGSDIIDLSYALEGRQGRAAARAMDRARTGRHAAMDFVEAPVVDCSSGGDRAGAAAAARAEGRPDRARDGQRCSSRPRSTARRGMDELHEQTVNLLSFQQLPQDRVRRAGCVQPG